MSLVNIANACAVECERQKVGIRELGYLLEAYQWLSDPDPNTPRTVEGRGQDWFLILGSMIEPGKNRHGFRKVPVTFQNGGSSANASEIPRLMSQLVEHIDLYQKNPDYDINDLVRQFLWIHPFADGNGRLSFILLNYLRGSLDDPIPLPDYNW